VAQGVVKRQAPTAERQANKKETQEDEAIGGCRAEQGRDTQVGSSQLAVSSLIWKLQTDSCKLE